jgi:hypothetical protein
MYDRGTEGVNSYYPIVIWEKGTKFGSSMNKIYLICLWLNSCGIFLWELGYEWTFNACKVCVVLWCLPVLKIQLVTVTITAVNFHIIGWKFRNFCEKDAQITSVHTWNWYIYEDRSMHFQQSQQNSSHSLNLLAQTREKTSHYHYRDLPFWMSNTHLTKNHSGKIENTIRTGEKKSQAVAYWHSILNILSDTGEPLFGRYLPLTEEYFIGAVRSGTG